MKKVRRGIVSVSTALLDEWMHLPAGTRVVDVRRREGAPFGEFEVLVEGDAVPESDEGDSTPYLSCTVMISDPKVEFEKCDPPTAWGAKPFTLTEPSSDAAA